MRWASCSPRSGEDCAGNEKNTVREKLVIPLYFVGLKKLIVAQEKDKNAPFGEVWDGCSHRGGKPVDGVWYHEIEDFEQKVLVNRI